jgi:hypothetical protein
MLSIPSREYVRNMFARKKLKGIGRGHTLAGVTHMNWNMLARKKL